MQSFESWGDELSSSGFGECGGNFCVAMQEESPTQEGDTGRAGALMSNTDGLFRSFGRRIHKTSQTVRGSDCTVELPRQF